MPLPPSIPCNSEWYVLIRFTDMPDDANEKSIRIYMARIQEIISDTQTSIEYIGTKTPMSLWRRFIAVLHGR